MRVNRATLPIGTRALLCKLSCLAIANVTKLATPAAAFVRVCVVVVVVVIVDDASVIPLTCGKSHTFSAQAPSVEKKT